MFHALAWLTVFLLIGLWSGLCAIAHAVLTWSGWTMSGDWATKLPQLELPGWIEDWLGLQWIEPMRAWLVEMGPTLHGWIQGLPDLGSWLGVAVWVVWGVGTFLLVLLGGAASGLIAVARRVQKPS